MMNLQHYQKAARLPRSKAPQTHKVPPLTYIAAPFFSLKERKLRTDEKHDTTTIKPISPIRSNRPQSANNYINNDIGKENQNQNPLSTRTATDVSKLHRKSLNKNTANPMHSKSKQAELLKEEKYEKQREIRQKLKNLFIAQKQEKNTENEKQQRDTFSEDDEIFDEDEDEDEEFEADDEDEEDYDEMSKLKQMVITEKLLKERVERLKRERMELEKSWNQQQNQNQYQFTSTTLMENELDKLHKKAVNESDSEYSSDDNSIDSIMSFSANDAHVHSDDSNDDEGMKTFANLRKQQSLG